MAGKSDSIPYQVVARRFRPTRFEDVVGQEAVVQYLQSALTSGQVPHAFMFSGSRGVGKTTLARILARALNCESGPTAEPCDKCAVCTSILAGTNTDVVEIDAASHNSVDDIRELRERVGLASMGSRYKVYLLDEVHMLSRSAFNAFLKTLEEPPPNVVFIMATTELHKVPDTIRSRCQVHLLRRVEEADIARRLAAICAAEKVAVSDEVLEDIAASSRGGMRDAESVLERLLPMARNAADGLDFAAYRRLAHRVGLDAVVELVGSLLKSDASAALRFATELVECGSDEREALGEILEILRAVLMLGVDGEATGLVAHSGPLRAQLVDLAGEAQTHSLEAMIHAGLQGRERMRQVEDRRLVLELTLLAMARAGTLPQLAELLDAARSGAEPVRPASPSPARVSSVQGAAAPAPVAERAPLPATERGELHGRMMAYLEQHQPLMARTIDHCVVKGPDDNGAVEIIPQTDSRLHRDRLATEGVQRMLRDALRELVGDQVVMTIGAASAEGPMRSVDVPAKPARGSRAAPGASVRKVAERFDGQILDSDDAAK